MKPAYSIEEIDFQSQTIKIYAPWKPKNIKNNEISNHQNQTADVKQQQIGIFETLNVESEIEPSTHDKEKGSTKNYEEISYTEVEFVVFSTPKIETIEPIETLKSESFDDTNLKNQDSQSNIEHVQAFIFCFVCLKYFMNKPELLRHFEISKNWAKHIQNQTSPKPSKVSPKRSKGKNPTDLFEIVKSGVSSVDIKKEDSDTEIELGQVFFSCTVCSKIIQKSLIS